MKAVVHIGISKTGTTAIQRTLIENRARLGAMGVLFDRYKEPEQASNIELALIALARTGGTLDPDVLARVFAPGAGPDRIARAAETAEQRIATAVARSEARMAVFSAEPISEWLKSPEQVAALDEFLRGLFSDVRYVVYIRAQEDWSLSFYSQLLRDGTTATLDEHARKGPTKDYAALLGLWAGVVSRDRLDIRHYDRTQFPAGNVVADFLGSLGLDPAALAPVPHQNESLSAPMAELYQVANAGLARRKMPAAARFREQTALRKLFNRVGGSGPKLRYSPEQIAVIRTRVAAGNEAVRARFFPDRAELFPARPAAAAATGGTPGQMAIADVADLLTALQMIERKMARDRPPVAAKVRPDARAATQ